MRIQHRIRGDRLVGGHADHAALAIGVLHATHEAHDFLAARRRGWRARRRHRIGIGRGIRRPGRIQVSGIDLDPVRGCAAAREHRTAQVGDVANRFTARQAVGEFADLPLAVAVHQQVRLGIQEHRAAHLLRPIIEMRNAAQRRLNAADDDRHVAERLARTLRVHDHRAVRPPAACTARGIGVVAAHAAIGGVAVDHRIHVAGGNAEEQVRRPEGGERVRAVPVGLRDDADPEALRLEHPSDDGHAEARVIDVGVAGHDDDVAAVPAEDVHLGARHGQERCGAEALGPVLAIAGDVACGLHGTLY